jgi:hypothetical protein
MSKKPITLRISEDLIKQVQTDIEKRGVTQTQWFLDAAEHYLACSKTEKTESMRLIVFKYAGTCLKCGRRVEGGEWGLYGRGVGVVCMDCYVEKIGDKSLVAKYLKTREYERLVKVLKQQADGYADKVEIYAVGEKHGEVTQEIKKTDELVKRYLTSAVATDQEKQVLENLVQREKDIDRYLYDLEEYLKNKLIGGVKIERKKQQQKAYET